MLISYNQPSPYLYTLRNASFASADSNPDRRSTLAIKQYVTGGSSDGCQLGVTGPQASEMLVSLHELEILTPVHVGQGSSGSPAHTCSGKSGEIGEFRAEDICKTRPECLKNAAIPDVLQRECGEA